MEKIDYEKQLRHLYKASAKKVEIADVPLMNFIMVDGEGDPNTSQSFSDAIETLFPLAYALKFMVKKGDMGIDYGVLPPTAATGLAKSCGGSLRSVKFGGVSRWAPAFDDKRN